MTCMAQPAASDEDTPTPMRPEILMKLAKPDPETLRREALRNGLLATVDLLKRRRAADIAEATIDEYVALHWLEWNGGSLRLTTTGENMCKQLTTALDRNSPRTAY
jgi:hypothetical protein